MEEKTEEKGMVLEKTISFEDFLREAFRNPFEYFEKVSILEVRKECIRSVKETEKIYLRTAEWIERCIVALLKLGYTKNCNNVELAEDLLSWYLFTAKHHEDLEIRALEFVINLEAVGIKLKNEDEGKGFYWTAERSSKLVVGRLIDIRQTHDVYHKTPSLKNFLNKLLALEEYHSTDGYSDSKWYCAKRALRIIISEKDYSFLPKIDELIFLFREKKIKPWMHSPVYTRDIHLAMLKATRRILTEAKREEIRQK